MIAHAALILRSFESVVGRALLPMSGDERRDAQALFDAPFAVLAHGTQDDPILFYGNAMALQVFDMRFDDFTRMPSRLTAEPLLRAERQHLMQRAAQRGYIDDYSGVRISSTGQRFRIENVVLWTIRDEAGGQSGQAAMVPKWEAVRAPPLDAPRDAPAPTD